MGYREGSSGCADLSRALQKTTVHLIISSHPHHMGTLSGKMGGSFWTSLPTASYLICRLPSFDLMIDGRLQGHGPREMSKSMLLAVVAAPP